MKTKPKRARASMRDRIDDIVIREMRAYTGHLDTAIKALDERLQEVEVKVTAARAAFNTDRKR